MSRILIIEDDPAILRGLKDNFKFEGYDVLTATDGELGHQLIRQHHPQVIVLDLMIPKLSGYELCRRIREEGVTTPILMLTARSEEVDRVRGLDVGADDYVTKPFSMPELLARVRAIFRRLQPGSALPDHVSCGDVHVDFTRCEARKGGTLLQLSRKEFGVLRLLAGRAGQVVTRDDMLDEVWGHDRFPTTRTVDNHIASLRAKLEDAPSQPRHLITVHGIGYKLIIEGSS